MAISGVQNPTTVAQTNNPAGTQAAQDRGKLGKEDFMKLLIAQLKNQDPNAPVDAKEFVTQLSQLTSVEQLTNMSTQLKNLQMATTSMVNTQASSFVGKQIEANGSKLYLGDSGIASSAVNLTAPADKLTVTIRNDTGEIVNTVEMGKGKIGLTPFEWDGKTSDGSRAPAGTYTMTPEAKDLAGKIVPSTAQITGIVNKVTYEQGFPELVVGDARVALANITSIKQ